MHVLIVPSWYPNQENKIRGIFFKEQALALRESGLKVDVIYPELIFLNELLKGSIDKKSGITLGFEEDIFTVRNTERHWLPKFEHFKDKHWLKLGMEIFRQYIEKRGKPDIIHAHSALLGGVLASKLKQEFKIPYIITEHSSEFARKKVSRRRKTLAKAAFLNSSLNIAVSPKLGELLREEIGQDIQYRWIPNLVSSTFENATVYPDYTSNRRDNIERLNQRFRFLNVALMNPNKQQAELIKAFSNAFKNEEVELRIAGEGQLLNSLKDLAKKLEIQNKVVFLGRLTRKAVLEEMLDADVFVLSSRHETFGIVLIEALTCGTPVIASRCGGPECIVREKDGLLVDRDNIQELSEAMKTMRDNINNYDPVGLREDCLTRFGSKAVTQQIIKAYEEVLNGLYRC